jgi:hypothetical protein
MWTLRLPCSRDDVRSPWGKCEADTIRVDLATPRHHLYTALPAARWFAWYPVVVSVEQEFDHWVWLEHLERKWSQGGHSVR